MAEIAGFYLDNDVSLEAAEHLAAAGYIAATTRGLGQTHVGDEEQLLIATTHFWVLVTHNARDYILLHDAWQRWSFAWDVHREHAGILILPQGPKYGLWWSAQVIAQDVLAFISTHDYLHNQLYWRKEHGWLRRDERRWTLG